MSLDVYITQRIVEQGRRGDWVKRNPMYCLDRGLVLRRIVKRTLRKARP